MLKFIVTEQTVQFRDNPEAQPCEPWIHTTWTLGAPTFADALRIVADTTGYSPRELGLARGGADLAPIGWSACGNRWRDLDGYKVDEEYRWLVNPAS